MITQRRTIYTFIWTLLLGLTSNLYAQNISPLEGRWDLEMDFMGKTVPSWLEIRHSGHATLLGRFVFAFGSARPISEIETYGENKFTFSIPNQWEPKGSDMIFHGELEDGKLKGTLIYTDGSIIHWPSFITHWFFSPSTCHPERSLPLNTSMVFPHFGLSVYANSGAFTPVQ